MRIHKSRAIAVAVTSLALLSFNSMAHADSTDELLKKLRDKGILSQDEYDNFNSTRDVEKLEQSKDRAAMKKGITISQYLDDVTLTGDIRARYEYRKATGLTEGPNVGLGTTGAAGEQLDRGRYAYHIGFVTNADKDFFAELRFASNNAARSPNVTFSSNNSNGYNDKSGGQVNVDRAYVGWNITDWATIVAGRMKNDVYKTVMKFDSDISPEGLSEKFKYKVNDQLDLFGSLNQWAVVGTLDEVQTAGGAVTNNQTSAWEALEQIGAHYKFDDSKSAKVAISYESYTNSKGTNSLYTNFNPNTAGKYGVAGTMGINNLSIIDIPAEFNLVNGNMGYRVWADYAHNFNADKRAINSGIVNAANFTNEDTAYLIGLQLGSTKDLKTWEKQSTYWGDTAGMVKHDWSGRLWWQHIEAFALNQNQIDSDIMNAMVNMEGAAASGIYMLSDNVFTTATFAHGSRINKGLGTGASLDTTGANVAADKYNMLQLDVTFKF